MDFHNTQNEASPLSKIQIKVLIMDVDGTMTDGRLYVTDHGEEFKAFSVKDGYGIQVLLPEKNVVPVVMTGKESRILERRCNELGISRLYQGANDKFSLVHQLKSELSVLNENIAYIGDDDNDLAAMQIAMLVGCPADASNRVKEVSDYISTQKGGEGAVRDFIEWMISKGYI